MYKVGSGIYDLAQFWLAIMAITGPKGNTSGSDPPCLLGLFYSFELKSVLVSVKRWTIFFLFLFFCRSKATQQFASRSAKAKLGCTCAVADGTCPVQRMNALFCHGSSGSTRPWPLTVRSMETSCSSMLAKVSETIWNKADYQTFQTKQKQKLLFLICYLRNPFIAVMSLKTTNKIVKFKILKPFSSFCLLFRTGMRKDFHQNA